MLSLLESALLRFSTPRPTPSCSTPLLKHDPITWVPPPLPPSFPGCCHRSLPSWVQQTRQGELIRRQEEALDRGRPQTSQNSCDTGPSKCRRSHSQSPYKRRSHFCKRSTSPKVRRSLFQAHAAGSSRQDKLPTCPVCLGRHRHCVASCQVTKTWNSRDTISTRMNTGRILNKQGAVVCMNWQ